MLTTSPFRKRNSDALGQLSRWALGFAVGALVAGSAWAGTFGTVVPIGGQASDLALDEARGVVYLANYTAGRIDVVSLAAKKIQSSMNVAAYPSSLSLSPDGRFLVVTHMANFQAPQTPTYAVTIINLAQNTRQTFTFGAAPFGVAFGSDGQALIVTGTDFLLLDPATGMTHSVMTMDNLIATYAPKLPVETPAPPREAIGASIAASGNLKVIWGVIQLSEDKKSELIFRYDATTRTVSTASWVSSPIAGPRAVSVNKTGSLALSGWGLYTTQGFLLAQFPNALGDFGVGGHAIDSARNLIYAQVPDSTWKPQTAPVLQIVDADNLNVRSRLRLKENLAGRGILNAAGDTMFAVSDSGLMILPVGFLNQAPQVVAQQEDVVFRGQWCNRGVLVQNLDIVDPGGNKTDFSLSTSMPGVTLSPASGTTPARVQVSVDVNAFQGTQGTASGQIAIASGAAVNIPLAVRVLINNRAPDQRGTFVNVPGKLVDLVADPIRNRFYVLRQDTNSVLVFDANNYTQIATLRTGNTPWSMAITPDRKYLITGADNSQVAHVFNLDTLQPRNYIVLPGGHYPRWIAASTRAVLAASRVAGPVHTIDQLQVTGGTSMTLPSLGYWTNDIDVNTGLVASPSGRMIAAASANGTVMLYDATADTFVAARQDATSLSGTLAALADNTFVVDHYVLNDSLVTVQTLETGSGNSSGFAMADGLGLRTTAPDAASPGVIQRVDLSTGTGIRPTRISEAPLLPALLAGSAFLRGLVALPNGNAAVALTTSGFTVLPADYDAAVATPQIDSIVSAADQSSGVAPGGLFALGGSNLSPVNVATSEIPLPTALGDSCLTINGEFVPMIYVSSSQINGQIPFTVSGPATMILRTPAGVSNSFQFNVPDQAPSVFETQIPNWNTLFPTIVREVNQKIVTYTNPIHLNDAIIIYATGLGAVDAAVNSGYPGPSDPLAQALVQPTVTLGGTGLPVSFAGLAPGEVGVYQIDAKVPFKNVKTGIVPLKISQGDATTTVNVRVVN